MNTNTEKPLLQPESLPCRHLRTKRMYIPALAEGALDFDQDNNDQSFYWCNKTLTALGSDDAPAHPCSCQPGRSCHET
jgi:hypothetical protein